MGSESSQRLPAFSHEECPSYLCEQICTALRAERARSARVGLISSSLAGISSILGLMFALPALVSAASQTGFTSFAALTVSDYDLVAKHFASFGLSLLEALPSFEVAVTLFFTAVFVVSLRSFVQSTITARFLHTV